MLEAGSPVSKVIGLSLPGPLLQADQLVHLCHAERVRSTPVSGLLGATARGHLYRRGSACVLAQRSSVHDPSRRSDPRCSLGQESSALRNRLRSKVFIDSFSSDWKRHRQRTSSPWSSESDSRCCTRACLACATGTRHTRVAVTRLSTNGIWEISRRSSSRSSSRPQSTLRAHSFARTHEHRTRFPSLSITCSQPPISNHLYKELLPRT